MRLWLAISVVVAVLLARTGPVAAVIGVKTPVSKNYALSRQVIVGKIVRANPGNGVVDVEIVETVKGTSSARELRVQIEEPKEAREQVAVGQPMVLFVGAGQPPKASVHVADRWLVADPKATSGGTIWATKQESADLKLSFPGRTEALVRIVGQIKAKKYSLLDVVENKVFQGGAHEIAKLKVPRPAFIVAADIQGNKTPLFLVGAADGVRLFSVGAGSVADVTAEWGLGAAKGACCATGDVNGDGKVDLLVGGTMWMNQGGKFAVGPVLDLPSEAEVLALGIGDLSGTGRKDLAAVCGNGELVVLENPGSADKPWVKRAGVKLWSDAEAPISASFGDWGDDGRLCLLVLRSNGVTRHSLKAGEGAADFVRLTGEQLDLYRGRIPNGLKQSMGTVIDVDGNGRPDFLIAAEGGGLLLVNRGFGAYRVVGDVMEHLKLPSGIACWTAAPWRKEGGDDLLVLKEDGSLLRVENPPAAKEEQ